jgi:hypothetical protein
VTTLNLEVAASADDASETGGVVSITETLTTVLDAAGDWIGQRFAAAIPVGATINSATWGIITSGTGNNEPLVDISCEDADSAAAFAATSNNISGRTRTTAFVTWDSADLRAGDGVEVASPDISTPVQEVVDRGGWASGNYIAVLVGAYAGINSARDLRTDTFDGSGPSQLDIDYTVASAVRRYSLSLTGVG